VTNPSCSKVSSASRRFVEFTGLCSPAGIERAMNSPRLGSRPSSVQPGRGTASSVFVSPVRLLRARRVGAMRSLLRPGPNRNQLLGSFCRLRSRRSSALGPAPGKPLDEIDEICLPLPAHHEQTIDRTSRQVSPVTRPPPTHRPLHARRRACADRLRGSRA
jgi:hypothetical protein